MSGKFVQMPAMLKYIELGLHPVLYTVGLELVSKELNHFGVIADLFRQIGGHSTRFVLFCSF